ncbi:MAG: hypothetical protein AMJ69_06140 [Gammaproteobacteria bacterium SG8_47]|nr:MAG: hypothetical protein AMJ69_06140 [Gammaproteobacteria bacterium SG8_47]
MYTACPFCQTIFRVTEAQLERARGRVRCGQCQQVFNAREHLRHEPLGDSPTTTRDTAPTAEPADSDSVRQSAAPFAAAHTANEEPPAVGATEEDEAAQQDVDTGDAMAELERLDVDLSLPPARGATEETSEDFDFEWPAQDVEEITLEGGPLEPEVEEQATDSVHAADAEPMVAIRAAASEEEHSETTAFGEAPDDSEAEPIISRAWSRTEGQPQEPSQGTDEQDTEAEELPPTQPAPQPEPALPDEQLGAATGRQRLAASNDDVPVALREALAQAQAPARSGWKSAAAIGLSVLLLATLAGQLVYYNRAELIQRYPGLTLVAQRVCAALGCTIELPRDVSRIVLVSRDVRLHPSVAGALLITATMNNEATFAQPCPDVELSLFDLTGTLVAQRRFAPLEYLDHAPEPGTTAMMQPNKPVRLRLEVRDPGQHAINYEFTFL